MDTGTESGKLAIDGGGSFGFDGGEGGGDFGVDSGGGRGPRACRNCGSEDHLAKECPEPRKPREGETCGNCGAPDHIRKDCPQPRKPKEGESCFQCGSTDHYSSQCPGVALASREKAPPERLEQIWNAVVEADKENDFEEIKANLLDYALNDPDLTWVDIEKKLREADLKTHIIAEPRSLPPSKELANNQNEGNKRYEVVFVRNARVLKLKIKVHRPLPLTPIAASLTNAPSTSLPQSEEDTAKNLEHLAEAGIIRERQRINGKYDLPDWAMAGLSMEQIASARGGCVRCGAEDHRVKECTQERPESKIGECFKCGEKGHSFRKCPNPDEKRMQIGCRRCGKEGHKIGDCPEPETCRRCGEEGHQQRDCPQPDPNIVTKPQTVSYPTRGTPAVAVGKRDTGSPIVRNRTPGPASTAASPGTAPAIAPNLANPVKAAVVVVPATSEFYQIKLRFNDATD
ncbi:hypothetical protein HK097_002111 [Rhizophlyctis rosea]|uniref:CCHC-type domain-containing protein n=1 Tax=Rhizophlyctis rosea TaxID=64517 RepID=A0AAD5S3R3_9FUNG|nr:hypothetical protein HK097_002111 [Rhizophlyctis rosea]